MLSGFSATGRFATRAAARTSFLLTSPRGKSPGRAHPLLAQLAQRKSAARKLLLRQSPEKVRLVLATVASAPQFPPAGLLVPADARVMAGGQALGANLARH